MNAYTIVTKEKKIIVIVSDDKEKARYKFYNLYPNMNILFIAKGEEEKEYYFNLFKVSKEYYIYVN